MQHSRDRKIIFCLASILLGGTLFGVWQHNQQIAQRYAAVDLESLLPEPCSLEFEEVSALENDGYCSVITPPKGRLAGATQPTSAATGGTGAVGNTPSPPSMTSLPTRTQSVRRQQTFSLVPPPPPFSSAPAGADAPDLSLPVERATVEPVRVSAPDGSLLDNLTLSAVIDNRAIFKVSPRYRREHGLRSAITLGPGDEYESVSVVTIDGKNVTVSEGQKRTVKSIASLR